VQLIPFVVCVFSSYVCLSIQYRKLGIIRSNFPHVPIIALTATATDTVSKDIRSQLKLNNPLLIRTTFNRKNLFFSVQLAHSVARDFTRELVGDDKISTIVYCPTRADCEAVTAHLQNIGINARAYHAALSSGERAQVHDDFIHDRVRVVVATVAFGMGIDHAETRKVINYGLVKNLESLVQMTGRAGRDGAEAACTLFYSPKDYALVGFWQKAGGNRKEHGDNQSNAVDAATAGDTQVGAEPFSRNASRMFDKVKSYVNDSRCRRVIILEYFGTFCKSRNVCGNQVRQMTVYSQLHLDIVVVVGVVVVVVVVMLFLLFLFFVVCFVVMACCCLF
jgi:RecQ family ATP-dependent DNA helicase